MVSLQKLPKIDISTSDPRTVVLMLDSPELNIISKACEAIHKHLEACKLHMILPQHATPICLTYSRTEHSGSGRTGRGF